ncbi:MAG: Hsp70 family protein [Candidatus Binatia bacterium]
MSKAFGLDFGTTNSALALAHADYAVELARFGAGSTFRSILYFEQDEASKSGKLRVVAGPDAIEAYLNARMPGRLVQSTKSYLASRLFSRTQIFNQSFSLEQLIGTLLRYLRKSAEAQFGDLGGKLVVGRPVHFSGTRDPKDDDFAVARLRKAFANAGFDEVHFLPEPVAAAYKYRQRLDHGELVLIADFGGGTSDFSLVKLQPAQASTAELADHVIGNDGIGIAGDTFDSKLVRHLVAPMLGLGSQYTTEFGKVLPVPNWFYEHLERWHYLSFLKTRKNMELLKQIRFQALAPEKLDALIELVDQDLGYRLHQAIEAVKCGLSTQTSSRFHFKEAAIDIEKYVARGDFEHWIGAEVSAIAACVDRLLADCNVPAHEIDAVFMTGGSSFVPAIRRIFDSKFPKAAIRAGQEFTSVAEGLALHALEHS